MRRIASLLAIALFAVAAVSPGTADAAKDSKSPPTAIQGYCPVAYVAMGKAVKGNKEFSTVVGDRRYLLTNADAKKMFDADPSKYTVAYDGYCATAISMGKELKSDPKRFSTHGGTTYLFSSADAKKAFDAMPEGVIEKSDAQWATMIAKK